jgi:hypothetical protein
VLRKQEYDPVAGELLGASYDDHAAAVTSTAAELHRAGIGHRLGFQSEIGHRLAGGYVQRADLVVRAPAAGMPVLLLEADRRTEDAHDLVAKLRRYWEWGRLLAPDADKHTVDLVRSRPDAIEHVDHDKRLWRRVYPPTGREGLVPLAFVFADTTARFRAGATPYSSSSRTMPPGVQETKPGSPKLIVANEAKVTPVHVLLRRDLECGPLVDVIAHRVLSRTPCPPGSADNSRSAPIISAVTVVAARATCREVMPASRQRFWLHADVGHGRRVLADQHGRETRRGAGAPGERGGLPRGVLHDAAGERGAVHQTGAWVWGMMHIPGLDRIFSPRRARPTTRAAPRWCSISAPVTARVRRNRACVRPSDHRPSVTGAGLLVPCLDDQLIGDLAVPQREHRLG